MNRIVFVIVACALVELVGFVFILQGLGILPGSFMTGDIMWTIVGAVIVLVANTVLVLALVRARG